MRAPLTPRRIFQAALTVIDEQGAKALTMRRVAASLGVEAMSLYYHVPNKDALVEGVLDLLVAEANLPTGDVDAEQWVTGTAEAFRRMAQAHPRAVPLLLSRPIPMADLAAAEPLEAGLAAFSALGRSAEDGFAAVQIIALSVLALGLLESTVILDPPIPESRVVELPADRLPLLHAVADLSLDLDRCWETLIGALVRGMTQPE